MRTILTRAAWHVSRSATTSERPKAGSIASALVSGPAAKAKTHASERLRSESLSCALLQLGSLWHRPAGHDEIRHQDLYGFPSLVERRRADLDEPLLWSRLGWADLEHLD